MLIIARSTALIAAMVALTWNPARAADPNWPSQFPPRPVAELISGQAEPGEEGAFLAGIRLVLGAHWKTYWRNPGAGGLPPRFDWSNSENLERVEILYPAPDRIEMPGGLIYGYRREVVFPVRIVARDPDARVALRLKLDYAVCDEICVPLEDTLALDLPAGAARPGPHAALLQTYARRVPNGSKRADGMRLEHIRFRKLADQKGRLTLIFYAPEPFRSPNLIVEGPDGYFFSSPIRAGSKKSEKGFKTSFRIDVEAEDRLDFSGHHIGVLFRDGQRILETRRRVP